MASQSVLLILLDSFFLFFTRSSWFREVREIKCEFRKMKNKRGQASVSEEELRADIFLTPLLMQKRPQCAKEKTQRAVPGFFTFGSKRLIPPPLSTSHLDLTAINIWCSNVTLKHDSPTRPFARCWAGSFCAIPKCIFCL